MEPGCRDRKRRRFSGLMNCPSGESLCRHWLPSGPESGPGGEGAGGGGSVWLDVEAMRTMGPGI